MKKLPVILLLFLSTGLFAQNNQNQTVEEEIELPDVTTVVNGKTFTAGKDSVPDYTQILPENSSPEIQLPEMESVKTSKNLPENKDTSAQSGKDIYAEGELGAGYPFYFEGDFSIYRASGSSPFEINFNHESAEGFARKKADEGYFTRKTSVNGKKSFIGNIVSHELTAEYKMSDDGLQLKSDSYSDSVKHTISASAGSDWKAQNGVLVSYGADGAWFNRYGEIMKNSTTTGDYADSTKVLDLNPYFGFGWQGHGFKAMLTGFYGLQANFAGNDNLLKAEGSSSSESSHRGQFKLALGWQNETFNVGADGSLIIGTATGSKEVIPAFTGIFDFKTESFTEGRYISFSARGGLNSYQEKIRNLENKYKFSVVPAIPTETTEWFSKITLTVPVLSSFEAKTGFEFKKTAFNNGEWLCLYDEDLRISGLYVTSPDKRTEFNTNLVFSCDFETVKASAEWKSYWKDVPSLEDAQNIKFKLEYQASDAKWNAGTSTNFAFGKNADNCPDISGWAGLRLASSLSLAFEVNDVIKLFHGTKRTYADSEYITTSGNAVLLVKFQF
ncbi:hypothetical protein [Treponema sp.]|uniref:hypothetical protein n=1 Tax=Treponema sp. TaxID=166 RepID=UPI00388EFBDC